MERGYKECPFCKNEIKAGAIKCQYCHEFLDNDVSKEEILEEEIKKEEKIKDNKKEKKDLLESIEKHEIIDENIKSKPSLRGRRFRAAFFDYIIDLTIVGWIYNAIMSLTKGRTFGFDVMGIKFITENGKELNLRQRLGRFLLYWPITAGFIVIIFGLIWLIFGFNTINLITISVYIFGIFNTVEWFFKSPTFYEKKLGIKKYQCGNVKTGRIVFIIILLIAQGGFLRIAQDIGKSIENGDTRNNSYNTTVSKDFNKGKGKNKITYGDKIETTTDRNGHQFKYGTISIGDITMMDRNLGAEDAGTFGYYYQRGNNYGFYGWLDPYVKTLESQVNASYFKPGMYFESYFILGYESWDSSHNNDLWGNDTNTLKARQGPCPIGWHIPTMEERQKVIDYRTALGYDRDSEDALIFIDNFKLPLAGFYGYLSNGLVENGEYGYYRTSSPYIGYDDFANVLRFYVKRSYYDDSFVGAEIQYENHIYRANGAQIRCFKNN